MEVNVQPIIDFLKGPTASREKVEEYLHHGAALVRVNALEAAVRLAKDDNDLLDVVASEAIHERNKIRLLGTTTVGHVAVGCLFKIGNTSATRAASQLLASWPEPERIDLIWYLKSEGLLRE